MRYIDIFTVTIALMAVGISGLTYYRQFILKTSDLRVQLISALPVSESGPDEDVGCNLALLALNHGNASASITNINFSVGRDVEVEPDRFTSRGTVYTNAMEELPIVVAPNSMRKIEARFTNCSLSSVAREASAEKEETRVSIFFRSTAANGDNIFVEALIMNGIRTGDNSSAFRVRDFEFINLNKSHVDLRYQAESSTLMQFDFKGGETNFIITRSDSSLPLIQDDASWQSRHSLNE